jgi:hypothetical protein
LSIFYPITYFQWLFFRLSWSLFLILYIYYLCQFFSLFYKNKTNLINSIAIITHLDYFFYLFKIHLWYLKYTFFFNCGPSKLELRAVMGIVNRTRTPLVLWSKLSSFSFQKDVLFMTPSYCISNISLWAVNKLQK